MQAFPRIGSLPAVRRAKARVVAVLAELPILFFAVVIGVALTFRVAIGWARSAVTEEPAPSHEVIPAPTTAIRFAPDPAASTSAAAPLPRPTSAPPPPARPPKAKAKPRSRSAH